MNLFCIPSVIYTSSHHVDHTGIRSGFSPEERLAQTVAQIESIVKVCSEADRILLLEGSELTEDDLLQLRHPQVTVIPFHKDPKAYELCHVHPNKSCYEVYVLKWAMENYTFTHFYKFGGRYSFCDETNLSRFQRDVPVFKVIQNRFIPTQTIVECILYCIPWTYKDTFIEIFAQLEVDTQVEGKAIENCLYERLAGVSYDNIGMLYVRGCDGIYRQFHVY